MELSFSKQFLSTISVRTMRIPPEYCEDPQKLPARTPYTLPKTPKPKTKRPRLDQSRGIPTATINCKSLRTPPISISLPGTPISTTALYLKIMLGASLNVPFDKIKILLKGKVLPDLKMLSEAGIKAGEEVGVTIMFMGGVIPSAPSTGTNNTITAAAAAATEATTEPRQPEQKPPTKQKTAGEEGEGDGDGEGIGKKRVMEEDFFWEDVKTFLEERLSDEGVVEDPKVVLEVWREAWFSKS